MRPKSESLFIRAGKDYFLTGSFCFVLMDDTRVLYPARIRRSQAVPTDEALLAIYRERFPDIDEVPFFFPAEISSNALDTYFTWMDERTLANFAEGAGRGVAVQDSHETNRLSYGRSLWGGLETVQGSPPGWDRIGRHGTQGALAVPMPDSYERVLSAAYVMGGIRFGNMTFGSTDDFIRAVRSGTVEEISVGFGGGRHTCDLCGSVYYSWDCPHIAGFTYELERQGDSEPQAYLATVKISNATLIEYSTVYAGATPNAAVLRKAEMEAEGGRLSPKAAHVIEERYRSHNVKLITRNWAGVDLEKSSRDVDMDIQKVVEALGSRAPAEQTEAAVLGAVRELGQALEASESERNELQAQAAVGRQYFADTVDAALAEGVRALGSDFDAEQYRNVLQNLGIAAVQRMRDDWKRIGDSRFQGGRVTNDGQRAEQERQPVDLEKLEFDVRLPDRAFGA